MQRVAVVTGAAGGIGAALVRVLAGRGVTAVAADVDEAGLARLVEEVPSASGELLDVTDGAAVRAVVDDVAERHGRLDYMFNNAGVVVGGDFEDMTDDVWRRVVDVNLWGVIHGTQAAYAVMLRQGSGHIVNTASSAGVMPVARSVAYAATKHAVVGLSTSLREEAAGTGVKVSVVLPGVVDTGIFAAASNVGDYDYQRAMQRVPFGKVSPERAAAAILEGVDRNRQFITFPAYNRALVALNRAMPSVMGRVINM